jgi:hypothetical protein
MFRIAVLLLGLSRAMAAGSVLDTINGNPNLSIFASLLQSTGFDAAFSGLGPYSVFGAFPAPSCFVFAVLL